MPDFLIRAALAGLGVAAIAGPLGCFVVWRRMAYFGEATAHAALLGVALALATELPVMAGVLAVASGMAAGVAALWARGYAVDTLLGVAAHGALAAGLVALAFLPGVRVDLMGYLFGDILAVSAVDVAVIWGGAVLGLAALAAFWRPLVNSTINAELAAAEGGNPGRDRLVLVLALAVLIAIALKVVGVLLVTALLVIPAAAARPLARTPEAMAVLAALVGAGAVGAGLWTSWEADTPAGPSIAVAALAAFIASNALAGLVRGRAP